jgi:hypothetical protein
MFTSIRQQDDYTIYTIDSYRDMVELTEWLDVFNLQYHVNQITVSRSEIWVKGGVDFEK